MAIKRYTLKGRIKPMREQVPTRIPRKPGKMLRCLVCGRPYRPPVNAARSRIGLCSRTCAVRKDHIERGL